MVDGFPEVCRLFLDDIDITFTVFGTDTVSPDDLLHTWRNIDISTYVSTPGYHTFRITSEGGDSGRVEIRVKIR